MKTKKIKEETYDFAKRGTYLPNNMHLDACQQGSRVYVLNHCNFQYGSYLRNGIEKGSMQAVRLHPTVNKRHQLPLCFGTETSSAG